MFKKPKKKLKISPDAFIRTPLRFMAIFQLCFAFYLLSWNFGGAFLEEAFQSKKLTTLFQTIDIDQLSPKTKEQLTTKLETLQSISKKSHLKMHPFEMAWAILSISIAIMLLKKNPAALQAIWLLPLITGFYIADNLYFGIVPKPSIENSLFPSENLILTEPLTTGILNQQVQLQNDWNRYLVKVWANGNPNVNDPLYEENLKKGNDAFNVARLNAYMDDQLDTKTHMKASRQSMFILSSYFLWNLLFAAAANSNKNKDHMFKLIPC